MPLVLVLALAACRDSAPTGLPGDLGRADMATAPCSDPDPAPGSVCPVEVSGAIAPEAGVAKDGQEVSVCAGLCFYGSTDAAGTFTVSVDAHIVLAQYALEVHGRPDAISYYAPLPPGTGPQLTFTTPLPYLSLPASGPAIPENGSAATLSAGDLSLSLPAGTKVLFSVEDYGIAHGHELRVRRIDPTTMPFFGAPAPAALYALMPFEAAFSQKVPLTIANSAGLPAGAAVDVRTQRGLLNGAPPAGPFVHAASAHVSSDGALIATDAGEGVSELTMIALFAL
jgi:hypothetical protein